MGRGEIIREEKGGTVKVYNDCIVEELTSEDYRDRAPGRMHPVWVNASPMHKKQRPGRATSAPVVGASSVFRNAARGAWLDRPSIEVVQAKADLETKSSEEKYMDVLKNEKTLNKEINDLINHTQISKVRKKELLHKKWTDRVYEPLVRNVINLIESPAYASLSIKKSRQYQEYLEHVNRKGHVYLDTFSPDEYFPLALQSSSLVAETKGLQDPLLVQENARYDEDRIVIQCLAGAKLSKDEIKTVREIMLPPLPLSRKDIYSNDWLAVPLVSIESPVRMASRARMKSSRFSSQIDFEKWASPRQSVGKQVSFNRTTASLVTKQTTQASRTCDATRPTSGLDTASVMQHNELDSLVSFPIQCKGTQTISVS